MKNNYIRQKVQAEKKRYVKKVKCKNILFGQNINF
jgi:hypothetical protein